jgi:hypothetical protein
MCDVDVPSTEGVHQKAGFNWIRTKTQRRARRLPLATTMSAIIVGSGCFGVTAAIELRKRGLEV